VISLELIDKEEKSEEGGERERGRKGVRLRERRNNSRDREVRR
jgi:hypothetical protein